MGNGMKCYAMYLPQFHDCPYNSRWWGQGFTEWTNVKAARPQFAGHVQPREPLGGYYDLSDPRQIEQQARLATQYGIDGFIFYHYWYEGQRPLGRPLDALLADRSFDVRFALCWANHSWTRSWTNRAGALDTLVAQTYERSLPAREKHYAFLSRAFNDPRYIRIGGSPLLQIHRPTDLPDVRQFVEELKGYCSRWHGLVPHVSGVLTNHTPNHDRLAIMDSLTLMQPAAVLHSPKDIFGRNPFRLVSKAGLSGVIKALPVALRRPLYTMQDRFFSRIVRYDYDQVWTNLLAQTRLAQKSGRRILPTGFVNFDNAPRYRNRARLFVNFTPEKFRAYFSELVRVAAEGGGGGECVCFINAWNEWGEGMYLEPDTFEGYARLEAVKAAVDGYRQRGNGTIPSRNI